MLVVVGAIASLPAASVAAFFLATAPTLASGSRLIGRLLSRIGAVIV
jgi:hypothetical protein